VETKARKIRVVKIKERKKKPKRKRMIEIKKTAEE